MIFDHFGIIVSDIWLDYAELTACVPIRNRTFPVDDKEWGVTVLMAYGVDGAGYELIQSLDGGDWKRQIGVIHHIAYRVSDLAASLETAKYKGYEILEGPKLMMGGLKGNAAFVRTGIGFIIELIEEGAVRRIAP